MLFIRPPDIYVQREIMMREWGREKREKAREKREREKRKRKIAMEKQGDWRKR